MNIKHQKYKELCTDKFSELFSLAQEENEIQFLTSFLGFHEQFDRIVLSYISDYEFREVLELVETFESIVNSDQVDARTKVRTMLLIYCHIVEVDLIYMVFFNMLRTIAGEDYSATMTFTNRKGKVIEEDYASKKIELINEKSAKLGIPLEPIYSEFYSNHVRNAFSHSRYFLTEDGEFNLSDWISPSSSQQAKKKTKPHFFNLSEIESIYEKAVHYLRIFEATYDKYITPYADGKAHASIYGDIAYNSMHGWHFVQAKS